MNTRWPRTSAEPSWLLVAALLLTACAAAESRGGGDQPDESPPAPAEALDCPNGRVVLCTGHWSEPDRCQCADRDTMRDVLEPGRMR